MKKLIVLVLFIVCVAGLVVYNNTVPKKRYVSNNVSYSDVEGVFIEIDSMCIYPDITTLVVSWNNKTEYRLIYGNSFWIERLENGKWVDCSLQVTMASRLYSLYSKECQKLSQMKGNI